MTALRSIPREVRWTVPLALIGLALAVPFSAPNGTGMQFNNADGAYNFTANSTLNGGDAGIDILTGSGGTFTFGQT